MSVRDQNAFSMPNSPFFQSLCLMNDDVFQEGGDWADRIGKLMKAKGIKGHEAVTRFARSVQAHEQNSLKGPKDTVKDMIEFSSQPNGPDLRVGTLLPSQAKEVVNWLTPPLLLDIFVHIFRGEYTRPIATKRKTCYQRQSIQAVGEDRLRRLESELGKVFRDAYEAVSRSAHVLASQDKGKGTMRTIKDAKRQAILLLNDAKSLEDTSLTANLCASFTGIAAWYSLCLSGFVPTSDNIREKVQEIRDELRDVPKCEMPAPNQLTTRVHLFLYSPMAMLLNFNVAGKPFSRRDHVVLFRSMPPDMSQHVYACRSILFQIPFSIAMGNGIKSSIAEGLRNCMFILNNQQAPPQKDFFSWHRCPPKLAPERTVEFSQPQRHDPSTSSLFPLRQTSPSIPPTPPQSPQRPGEKGDGGREGDEMEIDSDNDEVDQLLNDVRKGEEEEEEEEEEAEEVTASQLWQLAEKVKGKRKQRDENELDCEESIEVEQQQRDEGELASPSSGERQRRADTGGAETRKRKRPEDIPSEQERQNEDEDELEDPLEEEAQRQVNSLGAETRKRKRQKDVSLEDPLPSGSSRPSGSSGPSDKDKNQQKTPTSSAKNPQKRPPTSKGSDRAATGNRKGRRESKAADGCAVFALAVARVQRESSVWGDVKNWEPPVDERTNTVKLSTKQTMSTRSNKALGRGTQLVDENGERQMEFSAFDSEGTAHQLTFKGTSKEDLEQFTRIQEACTNSNLGGQPAWFQADSFVKVFDVKTFRVLGMHEIREAMTNGPVILRCGEDFVEDTFGGPGFSVDKLAQLGDVHKQLTTVDQALRDVSKPVRCNRKASLANLVDIVNDHTNNAVVNVLDIPLRNGVSLLPPRWRYYAHDVLAFETSFNEIQSARLKEETERGAAGTRHTFTRIHQDPNGMWTFVAMGGEDGKYWMFFQPRCSDTGRANFYGDSKTDQCHETDGRWVGVILRPGEMLLQDPSRRHAIYGLGPTFSKGLHFVNLWTLMPSLHGYLHCSLHGNSLTNQDHQDAMLQSFQRLIWAILERARSGRGIFLNALELSGCNLEDWETVNSLLALVNIHEVSIVINDKLSGEWDENKEDDKEVIDVMAQEYWATHRQGWALRKTLAYRCFLFADGVQLPDLAWGDLIRSSLVHTFASISAYVTTKPSLLDTHKRWKNLDLAMRKALKVYRGEHNLEQLFEKRAKELVAKPDDIHFTKWNEVAYSIQRKPPGYENPENILQQSPDLSS